MYDSEETNAIPTAEELNKMLGKEMVSKVIYNPVDYLFTVIAHDGISNSELSAALEKSPLASQTLGEVNYKRVLDVGHVVSRKTEIESEQRRELEQDIITENSLHVTEGQIAVTNASSNKYMIVAKCTNIQSVILIFNNSNAKTAVATVIGSTDKAEVEELVTQAKDQLINLHQNGPLSFSFWVSTVNSNDNKILEFTLEALLQSGLNYQKEQVRPEQILAVDTKAAQCLGFSSRYEMIKEAKNSNIVKVKLGTVEIISPSDLLMEASKTSNSEVLNHNSGSVHDSIIQGNQYFALSANGCALKPVLDNYFSVNLKEIAITRGNSDRPVLASYSADGFIVTFYNRATKIAAMVNINDLNDVPIVKKTMAMIHKLVGDKDTLDITLSSAKLANNSALVSVIKKACRPHVIKTLEQASLQIDASNNGTISHLSNPNITKVDICPVAIKTDRLTIKTIPELKTEIQSFNMEEAYTSIINATAAPMRRTTRPR